MTWQSNFKNAIALFGNGKYDDACELFSAVIKERPTDKKLFDARAAVLEKMERHAEALKDTKAYIDLAPDSWQGYARSSRLFSKIRKYDAATKMADLALARIPVVDEQRRKDIEVIRRLAVEKQEATQARQSKRAYHFGRLPFEIASTIFLLVADNDMKQAILLSHVCRYWREAALNTANLWRTFCISSATKPKEVSAILERSKGVTDLTIRMDTASIMSPRVLKEAQKAWGRLQCLHIVTPLRVSLRDIFPPTTVEQWRLTKFVLEDASTTSSFPVEVFENINTRSVTCLGMIGLSLPWVFISRFQSLSQLELRTSECSPANLFALLEANSGLKSLVLAVEHLGSRNSRETAPPSLALPQLTSMDLKAKIVTIEILHLLLQLPFQNTEIVSIDGLTKSTETDRILDHITSCRPTCLRELRLKRCAFNNDAIRRLLTTTPDLTTLEVSNYYGSNVEDMMDALAGRNPAEPNLYSKPCCPNLQYLDVSSCDRLRGSSLVHIVKSRLTQDKSGEAGGHGDHGASLAQIQSIKADSCPLIDPAVLPWLRQYVKEVSCVYLTKKQAKKATR